MAIDRHSDTVITSCDLTSQVRRRSEKPSGTWPRKGLIRLEAPIPGHRHWDLLDASRKKDADGAARIMEAHIDVTLESIVIDGFTRPGWIETKSD